MSQDRPDLSVASRVMSQHMSRPRKGIVPVIKRAIRYLKRCPRCRIVVSSTLFENFEISVWSDSDWASEQAIVQLWFHSGQRSHGWPLVKDVTQRGFELRRSRVECFHQCASGRTCIAACGRQCL